MSADIIAWDIGGAHLKAAAMDPQGRLTDVVQRQCPLWKNLGNLDQALDELVDLFSAHQAQHGITMTGELADCFSNRNEGVNTILHTVINQLGKDNTHVYAGDNGFIHSSDVIQNDYPKIASANWLATGQWAAKNIESALLIDIGSTTTDIIAIEDGHVLSKGFSDFDRLRHGELVYTGIVRTPVMAVANQVYFEGEAVALVAEVFATTADVYRLTDELLEYTDQIPAADNGAKTDLDSARRLARMIGLDVESASIEAFKKIALQIKEQQLAAIQVAIEKQISLASIKPKLFIGAGIGRFLVKEIANRRQIPYTDFSTLLADGSATNNFHLADCAPVVSLASLLRHKLYS